MRVDRWVNEAWICLSFVKTYLHDLIFFYLQLFDKVVSVLDPDLCINSASSLPTPTADHAGEEGEEDYTEPSKGDVNRAKQGMSANTMQVYWKFDW